MKGALLLILALFIDGFTAGVGLIIFIVAAVPGTVGGAAAGCAAGATAATQAGIDAVAGCQLGGFIGSLVGSIPGINQGLAVVTAPIGAILSVAIDGSLNIVLGGLLIVAIFASGMMQWKYLFLGSVKIIPFVNLFPWYTTVVILCIVAKHRGRAQTDEFIETRVNKNGRMQPQLVQAATPNSQAPKTEQPDTKAKPPEMQEVATNPKEKKETSLLGINGISGYRTPTGVANSNQSKDNNMLTFRPVGANENRTWAEVQAGKGQKYEPMERRMTVEGGADKNITNKTPPTPANSNRTPQSVDYLNVPKASNSNTTWEEDQKAKQKKLTDDRNSAV